MASDTAAPASVRGRNRSSVWFFLVLILLGTTAITIETWFNLNQQLTVAQLDRARSLWQQNGPADYDLVYTLTRQSRSPADLVVTLRNGQAVAVVVDAPGWEPALAPLYDLVPAQSAVPNESSGEVRLTPGGEPVMREFSVKVRQGKVVQVRCDGKSLPAGVDREAYSMEGLYAAVGRQLELDAGPRVFAVATFGRGDNRLLRYVRSYRPLRERVELKLVDLAVP